MCRWMAYSGKPVPLETLLFKAEAQPDRPEHELALGRDADQRRRLRRRLVRGARPIPGLFRSIRPAWNDFNLRDLAAQIDSHLFLAHVRATSLATVQETNCHPFRHGRWLFVHNGEIGGIEKTAPRPAASPSTRSSSTRSWARPTPR